NRWLALGIALVAVLIASVYFFIPSRLLVTKIVLLHCNRYGADRVLKDTGNWARWWPRDGDGAGAGDRAEAGNETPAKVLTYKGVEYRLSRPLHLGEAISIDDKGAKIPSILNIFPLGSIDSSYLQWQFTRGAGWNPIRRIGHFRQASRLKTDMAVILDSLQHYLEDPANIYGITITEASSNDSFLVETRQTSNLYPGTGAIYDLVKRLDRFVNRRGGKRTGYPMVNVDPLPNREFLLRTAIPVDKAIADSGDIVFRKLVHGNYLE